MILLKQERSLIFKALMLLNIETQQALKLWGEGPSVIEPHMVQNYFKYDSASKSFKQMFSEVSVTKISIIVKDN